MDLVHAFPAHQRDLATRAQLAAAGLGSASLHRALAAGEVVRVARSVYGLRPLEPWARHLLTGGTPDPAFLRHAQAVLLSLGPSAALAGRSAAVVRGLDLLVEPEVLDVQVAPQRGRVRRDRVRARRTEYDVRSVAGLPVTSVQDTLRDIAKDRPLAESVAVIDSALRRRLVVRTATSGRLGRAVALADPLSGSVLESALRVLLAQARLPRPVSQYVIRSGDGFVARVDLAWPSTRLVVEADGRRWHDPEDARVADRRRTNACAALGWRVLRFTWREVLHEPEYVVATVRAALTRSRTA